MSRKITAFVGVVCLIVLSIVITGCNKKQEAGEGSAANASAPAAPSKPVPSYSAAQKVGLYVFPAKSQTKDQQLIDEAECYDAAQQSSGINPETLSAPKGPSSGEVQAAQEQAAASAQQSKGGRARGAARGAAGGAMIGAIAGDAGTGAAIGATMGTVRGGRQQRQSNAAAKEQAANQAGAQVQQQHQQAKAAYNQQLGEFKRAFSACLDARGYSVK